MKPSWRERREQRRWSREAMRRLEQLDHVDREHGLGAMPHGTTTTKRFRYRPDRNRRRRSMTLPGVLVSSLLAGTLVFQGGGMNGYRLHHLVSLLRRKDTGSYTFMQRTTAGDPVGWNHCYPISFAVNPDGAPDNWHEIVGDAVDITTDASGFSFRDSGTTTAGHDSPGHDSKPVPPVVISWSDADRVPELAGTVAGIGGSSEGVMIDNRVEYISGEVVLDTDTYDRLDSEGDEKSEELILAHELGHVLGLDHVQDIGELMYPKYVGQDGFGPGDKEGFKQLHDLPCD